MYFVYAIRSYDYPKKIYVGYTTDLKQRLKKHDSGGSIYTAKFRPWKLILSMEFETLIKAKEFEQYLKTPSGKAFASKRLW